MSRYFSKFSVTSVPLLVPSRDLAVCLRSLPFRLRPLPVLGGNSSYSRVISGQFVVLLPVIYMKSRWFSSIHIYYWDILGHSVKIIRFSSPFQPEKGHFRSFRSYFRSLAGHSRPFWTTSGNGQSTCSAQVINIDSWTSWWCSNIANLSWLFSTQVN